MRFKFIYLGSALALLSTGCQKQCCESDCYVDQQYYHKYGAPLQPDDWCQRGSNGQVITTLRDGVVCKQTYANGELHGESTYTYPNSQQVQRVEVHSNDQLVKQNSFHVSGIPEKSVEYSTPDIRTETTWYESGHPRSIEKYKNGFLISGEYFNTQNLRDSWVNEGNGERLTRDPYGTFLSLDTFRGGQLVSQTLYYPNKTPKEIIPFQNGQVHGERKTYYPGGDPMTIEGWANGLQNGTTIIFQNGEKYAEVPYVAGKKNGVERRFRDGSVVTQEITWVNDKMHGPMYTYVGESTQTDWYYNGRLTTRSNFESFGLPKKQGI